METVTEQVGRRIMLRRTLLHPPKANQPPRPVLASLICRTWSRARSIDLENWRRFRVH